MLCWRKLGTALAVILLGFASGSVWAEFTPKISLIEPASVMINGKAALRFRTGNGNLSADERAELTWRRLCRLRNQGIEPGTIIVKAGRRQVRVVSGATVICSVTAADAKKSGLSRLALAGRWASNMRRLLSMPAVTVSEKELIIPLGEKRRVMVGGAATGPIYANTNVGAVATAEVGTNARYVEITGRQVGESTVDVCVEGEHTGVDVNVMKYAGSMPSVCVAKVTGNPCPPSLTSYAAKQIATQSAVLEPGAHVKFGRVRGTTHSLRANEKNSAAVEVTISGPGYLTYSLDAPVEVQNVMMPRDEASQLFYSNDPERLTRYQSLFMGQMQPGTATRVLYHHQNMMHQGVHLVVEVINPNDFPNAFRVFGGIASPTIDPVSAGHVAGAAFLRHYQYNASVIEKIPPRSRLVLVSNLLGYQDTASGILQLTNLDGGRAYLKVVAQQPGVDNVSRGAVTPVPNVLVFNPSDDVFPFPAKNLEANYVVGEQWAFIALGKHGLDGKDRNKLFGDYGVIYNINVSVQNPTGDLKNVAVVFDPSAGIASGAFIIDGKFVVVRSALPPSEITLVTYRLRAGETRNIRITTVPLAGSNYPANLIVRSL